MNKTILYLALSIFMLLSSFAGAEASSSPVSVAGSEIAASPDRVVTVRLVSGISGVGHEKTLPLGLDVVLAQGWKTYWRFAGTAGFAPTFDWSGSSNVEGLGGERPVERIFWPVPTRYEEEGLHSYGYKTHVLLPMDVSVQALGEAVHLQTRVELMACNEICVPYAFDLSLDIPEGVATPSRWEHELLRWKNFSPAYDSGAPPPLQLLGIKEGEGVLELSLRTEKDLQNPDVFIDGLVTEKPEYDAGKHSLLRIPFDRTGDKSLVGGHLRVTLVDYREAGVPVRWVEKVLPVTAADPVVQGGGEEVVSSVEQSPFSLRGLPSRGLEDVSPPPLSVGVALLFAFIGGLVLNLMPCVLPVLSLKVFAAIQLQNRGRDSVRRSFLATAMGIVFSFMVLAILAIVLRHAGAAVGWGIQFQSPVFLGVMVFLLTIFAASMWDLLHIPLPGFVSSYAIKQTGAEIGEAKDEGAASVIGAFLVGVFTTLLATPCSAPFVGTALGFALAGSDLIVVLVALFMGVGLAVPYFLVAVFPGVARYFPKPGRWMGGLRAVLGGALLITAIWLASVLASVANVDPVLSMALSGSSLLLLFVLWIRAAISRPFLLVKGFVLITFVFFALSTLERFGRQYDLSEANSAQINWTPFDESVIPSLVQSGKVVFVDVSASWCLTCKVNEATVLYREPTLGVLAAGDVVNMLADWTERSRDITDFLVSHQRRGIPFYVVYGPNAPGGIVLPELLTAQRVKDALDQARAVQGP